MATSSPKRSENRVGSIPTSSSSSAASASYPPSPRSPAFVSNSNSNSNSNLNSLFTSLLRVDSIGRSTLGRRLFGSARSIPQDETSGWIYDLARRPAAGERVAQSYLDRTAIDWAYEDRKERARLEAIAMRTGLAAGLVTQLVETSVPWIIVISIGVAVGLVAGCLDVLAGWLGDLRMGRCGYAFYLNKNSCCSGLEPHEECYEWETWPAVFQLSQGPLSAFLQYVMYIAGSVSFAGVAAILVRSFAPFAFHTGIPEIKVILSGFIFRHYLSAWTLIIKAIGLAFAVASGLSLGKEGPLVHVSCCVGNLIIQPFRVFRDNEARKREMLSAAAAAGVSVAFGAPLGGVLFVLEELSLSSLPQATLWRAFVCAVVATMTLQYFDPFKSGKLVLFQVQSEGQVWRAFELVPWVFLGLCGGLFGAAFIRVNIEYAKIRRSSALVNHPIFEVLGVATFTSLLSYLLTFTRVPTSQLVEALFQDCGKRPADPFGLCDPNHVILTMIMLVICALSRSAITAVTFGIQVPSGIFLPAIGIGACFGRAVGIFMNAWQQSYPSFWLFGACPPEGACISPQVYAVIGAASAVGGLTRMTISLVVIIFELTGAVELVLQIMMAVMISKFTADYFSVDGIYEAWINFRGYPYLSPKDSFSRVDLNAKDIMVTEIVSLPAKGWTLDTLEEEARRHTYKGYPIVSDHDHNLLMGYIPSNELKFALKQARSDWPGTTPCHFFSRAEPSHRQPSSSTNETNQRPDPAAQSIDLNKWVDEAPLTLELNTPVETVLQYFQRLGLKNMIFTSHGVLVGMITKKDLYKYVRSPFYSSEPQTSEHNIHTQYIPLEMN